MSTGSVGGGDYRFSIVDEADEAGEQAETPASPSVVAVVVTHNPGPWFEDCLASLVEQDYENLLILVLDAGSDSDPTPRIASVVPGAYVRRLARNPGYGVVANQGTGMVEGAAFYLHCHDDVALAPSTVRLLVEEAYRSNAGIVGPKFVGWDEPDRLLQVGLGSDKFAVPSNLVERRELDQEQHDGVRDVFAVPTGCQLIRTDLLKALAGFDEAMPFCGEDIDLCWRAHLAGARVLVAPAARVRHAEALPERGPDSEERFRLEARHHLRTVLGNYGLFYLVAVVPQQAVLSLIEFVIALLTGRLSRARSIVGAYVWNLGNLRSLLAKRRRTSKLRQVTDLEIRRLQVHGSARFSAFVRGQFTAGTRPGTALSDSSRRWAASFRQGVLQQNLAVLLVSMVVLGFGSRYLLTAGLPVIGEFPRFPASGSDLVRTWWSGWRSTGLGTAASAPFGELLAGVVTFLLFGAEGFARTLLVLACLPLGVAGAYVAASEEVVQLLINRGRSFVFTTAPPVPQVAAAGAAVALVASEVGDSRRAALWVAAARLRDGLRRLGRQPAPGAPGHIIPWVVGDSAAALAATSALFERGLFVQAIRPPTVPEGSARLRVTLMATHTADHIDRLLEALADLPPTGS